MESVQRPQSSSQSKRPEDQALAALWPALPAGAAPTGKPVATGSAWGPWGFISMYRSERKMQDVASCSLVLGWMRWVAAERVVLYTTARGSEEMAE